MGVGEKKGIVGIVEGILMVGIGGNVVGNVGNCGLAGNGGNAVGKVGNVGFGRVGAVGSVGKEGFEGSVGSEGNGGSVGFGRDGIVGIASAGGGAAAGVSKRWRAAWLIWVLETNTTTKEKMKQSLGKAMVEVERRVKLEGGGKQI
ncbi:unnamed protein product [Prunus armeniaca]|uniref:Uncharacterized protein n=1 Tax=Prunus armeniaca TaxID=36596 RepID=A0A6J5V7T0_PRUAR|nr:unnamed protein product [Prunus armeniaca]